MFDEMKIEMPGGPQNKCCVKKNVTKIVKSYASKCIFTETHRDVV